MIQFLIKGLARDRTRSLFPVIIVAMTVALMVYFHCTLKGFVSGMLWQNARFDTGHVKIVSRQYAEQISLKPYDLALLHVDQELEQWKSDFPELRWTKRVWFGGLLDVPDEHGETRAQGEVSIIGADIVSSELEHEMLKLDQALVSGSLPAASGQVLVSHELTRKLDLRPGSRITIMGSTVWGSMSLMDFEVAGTVTFGVTSLDRGGIVMDISDAQDFLDMGNGAAEILGFFPDNRYHEEEANRIRDTFNQRYYNPKEEFSPYMLTLLEQNGIGTILTQMEDMMVVWVGVFMLIIFIVLWNSGLLSGIRRWGEMGVRIAIGEPKFHIFSTLLAEAVFVGLAGSVVGTLLGLAVSWWFQEYGLDMSAYIENSTMMIEPVMRARITPEAWLIGFIPGVVATIVGSGVAGLGIFRRQTAQLFKELDE